MWTFVVALSVVAQVNLADGGVDEPAPLDGGPQSTQAEDKRLEAANAAALVGGAVTAADAYDLSGYVEAFYQWNFNDPSNGITAWRGFDNRHNTFTVGNAVVDLQWDYENVVGRVALQVGHTPSSYYLAEPGLSGAAGVNASNVELWKYVQQGFVGYRFPVGRGLLVQAGLFLSPIGPEGIAVRDNWNWSRSTLFFALPYYHTGLRASASLTERWAVTLAAYNGWNSVVDNNGEKSFSVQATWAVPEKLALSFLYFGGVERPRGAVEGRAWRHLGDAHVTWFVTKAVALLGHVSGGFEANALGLAAWAGASLSARLEVRKWLFLAVRGDALHERVPSGGSPIFFGLPFVGSGTATVDVRPHPRVSFRLEYRRDQASTPIYFRGQVDGDGQATPWVPSRAAQDTLTLGATTWF
ncbi:MAG: porin [Myxococcaceae bacterium]|jgi:hypothetical protein|nr:porin [Myxococcaceae bacterium]